MLPDIPTHTCHEMVAVDLVDLRDCETESGKKWILTM